MFLTRLPRLRTSVICGSLALVALCGLTTNAAQARVFIGVGVGVPLFYPPVVAPPYYYPPYYAPPYYGPPSYPDGSSFSYAPPNSSQPQNLAPPPGYAPGGYTPSAGYGVAQSCQAGAYVCPLVAETPPGGRCSCPGQNGQRIRGQAN
jgi:hypothetical protein